MFIGNGRNVLHIQVFKRNDSRTIFNIIYQNGKGGVYYATIRCGKDRVLSYVGLRSTEFKDGKYLFNGESVFQRLVLDQGFYPDGIYTAPTKEALENEMPARSVECDENEKAILDTVALLTSKPVIYACNMSEDDFANNIDSNVRFNAVCEIAKADESQVLPICAELEAEIASLDKEEKEMFLAELGVEKGGLDLLIQRSYDLLGLISYLTAGAPEVRAWTIRKGTKAPQAAGKIHSDFERGFIRAEVISFDDLMANGSMAAAKEKGLVRSEGKEYVMQDGDIVLFRFNV